MRILALDAALGRCSAGVLAGDTILAERHAGDAGRGQAAVLPGLVQAVLVAAGGPPEAVAVTVGPGSFTGLRAGLALAHGVAASLGIPLVGVTVAEALAAAVPTRRGRALWVALGTGRAGRVFLDIGGALHGVTLAALPHPAGPVALAGDAAAEIAAWLAARGADVLLTEARRPTPAAIAAVARRRLAGALPPLAAAPLYVDPPEARLPAAGRRPPPPRAAARSG